MRSSISCVKKAIIKNRTILVYIQYLQYDCFTTKISVNCPLYTPAPLRLILINPGGSKTTGQEEVINNFIFFFCFFFPSLSLNYTPVEMKRGGLNGDSLRFIKKKTPPPKKKNVAIKKQISNENAFHLKGSVDLNVQILSRKCMSGHVIISDTHKTFKDFSFSDSKSIIHHFLRNEANSMIVSRINTTGYRILLGAYKSCQRKKKNGFPLYITCYK